jgi:hypothetical protein
VIARLDRMNPEQRKLLFSLGTNFLTRIPGAIGILWFLPLLCFGLGTDEYAKLLTAMALGSAAAFLFGGFSLVGRRLIGEAYANGDRAGEAAGVVSLFVANAVALGLALSTIAAYCWVIDSSTDFMVVAALSSFGLFLTTFDNVRSAYNEHYVTATLQFVLQVTIYAVGFLVPATRHSVILASLVVQSHYMLASLITFALLLRHRPYLMGGRPVVVWPVARQGTILAMADGLMMATLSLAVVWLQSSASSSAAAWFATIVRLFQTFLVPVILLLIPLSSYIRISWNGKSIAQQQAFAKTTLSIGLGYGAVVAVALLGASQFYVGFLLHLPAPGDFFRILPSFLLFGAIVAYKSFSSIAYLVLDEPVHLSLWTAAAVGAAVVLGVAASFIVDPLSVINVYSLVAGLSIIVVLCWNAARFIWPSASQPSALIRDRV